MSLCACVQRPVRDRPEGQPAHNRRARHADRSQRRRGAARRAGAPVQREARRGYAALVCSLHLTRALVLTRVQGRTVSQMV